MNLQEALSLGDRRVISLVGAGGKTSLMYSLARELVTAGKKVLTTTTTKIFMPTPEESPATIISGIAEEIVEKATALLADHSHLTVGAEYLAPSSKLQGLAPSTLERILQANLFDFIIIEADGAARRSLKACAPHEPVVPVFSDCVVALVGLDAAARPLAEEWVFRSAQFSRITGLALHQNVTETSIARAMLHDIASVGAIGPECLKVAFLNKADTLEALHVGQRIAGFLEQNGGPVFNRIVIGELRPNPNILECRVVQHVNTPCLRPL